MDDVDAHLRVLNLGELRDRGLDRSDHVALEHKVEVADRTGLHLLEQVLNRHPARGLRELLAAQTFAARIREIARSTLVLDDATKLTGGRRLVEAEDLDRLSRPRLLHLVAAEVVKRAHLPPRIARDDRVTDVERAAMDEHGRDGAAADVEA